MANTIYLGKYMYAIFSNMYGLYVQPCKILNITNKGFSAECHNGGETGHECGTEYFSHDDIGKYVFYSKDAAQVVINRINNKENKHD